VAEKEGIVMTQPVSDPDALIEAARLWFDAGYCVVPSHEDGKKRPFGRWDEYQQTRMPWGELERLLTTGKYTGIGVICGAASGNVEMIETEGPMPDALNRLERVIELAKTHNKNGDTYFTDLIRKITKGCVEKSAGGGLHFFVRITDGPALGNTILAKTTENKVIAETRGHGGFVITAPTPARIGHPDGASYMFVRDSQPAHTPNITSEDRDVLHLLFRLALNEKHDTEQRPERSKSTPSTVSGESTFDAYRATSWADILTPHGWTWSHRDNERDHWVRPGKNKTEGTSATTIDNGPMSVFSSNTTLPTERGLSKADVYAHLNHGGDLTAAARDLQTQGYGNNPHTRLATFILGPLQGETTTDTTDTTDTDIQRLAYEQLVREAAYKLKITKDAKHLLARIELGNIAPLEGVDMDDFLNQQDEEEHYRIHGLWPAQGRVLLAAAAKAGKTTMVIGNLLPSLIDGIPFLGNHATEPTTRRIVVFNMEVGERTLRTWMRKSGIQRSNQVTIVNLRGKASALQLATEEGRARLTQFLISHNTEIVILDPLAPVLASLGLDENDNSQIAQFFSWWSEALTAAGVHDDLIVHHTGHAGERSRGASRLLDEPDAIWTLKRDRPEDDPDSDFQPLERRYLHAYGRDVELPDSPLSFDPDTGRLRIMEGTREQIRAREKAERYYDAILQYVRDNPGASTEAIKEGLPYREGAIGNALKQMRDIGLVDFTKQGKLTFHFVRDTPNDLTNFS
jgi:hypothetical protein